MMGMLSPERYRISRRARPALLLLGLTLAIVSVPTAAHAITTLSQGFNTKDKLALGSIVSLINNSSDQVAAATHENVDSIYGIVIDDGSSLLSLSTDRTKQVQVATSGIVRVLVSNINGDIKQGDQITASSIAGVGMKATENVKVVGIAQGDLSKSNTTKQKYKDKDGKEQEVILGEVTVLLNVAYFFKQPEKTIIPSAIQDVANSMAGKDVKPLPILISLAIFVVSMVVVVSMVFSMIRSSIISIGRNPMSQSAVYRNLIQMSAVILVILGVTVVSIYMVLTRF